MSSRRLDVGIPEMVREAIDRCLDTRDLALADVDAIIVGNMEMFEGINMVEHWLADALGAAGKPLWKLNNGGTVGSSTAVMAYYLVASGFHRRVLCVGFEKQSEGSSQSAITTVGDPIWERAVMAGAIGNFAAMTSVYVNESGVTPEQAAKVAVKARRNATRNPHAHLKIADITVEKVLASDMLAYPVRKLDFCPSSDGAVAVLFAADEDARALSPRPAWVHAAVTAHDQQYMGDSPKRLAEMRSLIEARTAATRTPGSTIRCATSTWRRSTSRPPTPSSRCTSASRSARRAAAGATSTRASPEMDGALPVNPSGGVLSTNPVGATALIRVAEAALQVMNEAGEHQVPNVKRALATGYGGNAWTDLLVLGSGAAVTATSRSASRSSHARLPLRGRPPRIDLLPGAERRAARARDALPERPRAAAAATRVRALQRADRRDWVEVGPTATLAGYTVVYVPFIDPMTGVERPVPTASGSSASTAATRTSTT